ncbi:hypothetical protein SDC9_157571 [bioreactor metagenome]|uniref:Uncharacterized protein n=1 Tax=bioreactor metagenome TaxID=1076179 RepID=A0A645F9H6_9ZZZZ
MSARCFATIDGLDGLNHLLQLGLRVPRRPVQLADVPEADAALGIQNEAGGQRTAAPGGELLLAAVQQHIAGERNGLEELRDARGHLAVVHGQHAQLLVAVQIEQHAEGGHLQPARAAVRRPEIHDQRRAYVVLERDVAAIHGEGRERWCIAPRPRQQLAARGLHIGRVRSAHASGQECHAAEQLQACAPLREVVIHDEKVHASLRDVI